MLKVLKKLQKVESKLSNWIESYLFYPTIFQKFISILLLPLSLIYLIIIFIKRFLSKQIDFNIPIISVGNIVVGGSGKTPFVIELSRYFDNSFVILRGYGRKSKGFYLVSLNGEILCDVDISGDEAMLIAKKSPQTSVIVSENRDIAIEFAKSKGAKIIILDDGFSKYHIKKFDIILEPDLNLQNRFTLPSGAYREPCFSYRYADLILRENRDYFRETKIINPTKKMILVTAIANPKRLDKFLPNNLVDKIYLSDHSYFDKKALLELLDRADSLLVTEKDFVKLEKFDLPLSILSLNLKIDSSILNKITLSY